MVSRPARQWTRPRNCDYVSPTPANSDHGLRRSAAAGSADAQRTLGRKKMRLRTALLAGAVMAFAAPATAQVNVTLEPYVTGVNSPLAMVQPPGDDRKFVVEQFGRIRIINAEGELEGDPFLDIRDRIVPLWGDFDERGLLGLAFHPDFATNGKFYIAYSAATN